MKKVYTWAGSATSGATVKMVPRQPDMRSALTQIA